MSNRYATRDPRSFSANPAGSGLALHLRRIIISVRRVPGGRHAAHAGATSVGLERHDWQPHGKNTRRMPPDPLAYGSASLATGGRCFHVRGHRPDDDRLNNATTGWFRTPSTCPTSTSSRAVPVVGDQRCERDVLLDVHLVRATDWLACGRSTRPVYAFAQWFIRVLEANGSRSRSRAPAPVWTSSVALRPLSEGPV